MLVDDSVVVVGVFESVVPGGKEVGVGEGVRVGVGLKVYT